MTKENEFGKMVEEDVLERHNKNAWEEIMETHPSVRIKGSENVYSPVDCQDEKCFLKAVHMHCPFCVKSDSYFDPVILKAHYRVKHVDKGIEFAGLKILRCCDHCDIIGVIKGEKKFKGPHWHCYRCRNGFNRRDEAIKHYKTHFRNPQTTFQISITEDLNNPVPYFNETQKLSPSPVSEETSLLGFTNTSSSDQHPVTSESVSCISSSMAASLSDDGITNAQHLLDDRMEIDDLHVTVASVNQLASIPEDGGQIVIIHEEVVTDDEDCFHGGLQDTEIVDIPNTSTLVNGEWDERKLELEHRVRCLEKEKSVLQEEVLQLHKHILKQEEIIQATKLKGSYVPVRFDETSERCVADILECMAVEHRQLLQHQLDVLKGRFFRLRAGFGKRTTDSIGDCIEAVSIPSSETLSDDHPLASQNSRARSSSREDVDRLVPVQSNDAVVVATLLSAETDAQPNVAVCSGTVDDGGDDGKEVTGEQLVKLAQAANSDRKGACITSPAPPRKKVKFK